MLIMKKKYLFLRSTILFILCSSMLFGTAAAEPHSAENTKVPLRSEISDQYKWHLNDIYASNDLWQSDFDKLKAELPRIAGYKGKLGNSAQNLLQGLKLRDEIYRVMIKLAAYAQMHRDENTADAKYQVLAGKAESLAVEVAAATSFVQPEILALPDKKLAQFRQTEAGLKEYAFYFDDLVRQKKHVLSPEEEGLLARSAEATQVGENAFDMLVHADIRFPEITDEKGQKVQLSEGRYFTYVTSPDRNVRKRAYHGLFGTYNQYRNTLAATLGGTVKKNIFYAKVHKYDSALAAAIEGDNVPMKVYDNLITTVHNNLEPLHRYVMLKKKALGLSDIHMYDLYTPIVHNVKLEYEYKDGVKLVETALAPLGPEYCSILDKGLTSGWVDVYENKGKQTGAYSSGTYGVHPFVLLNYHNRYDDVSTIAHEMGHAMHSYYSQSNRPFATAQYSIFCAEVASTTNEVLLIDHMLKTTTDKKVRLYLLNQYLEAIRTTVYRQALFAEFEKIIYAKSEKGETLTADMLDATWHELNVKYYGPEIVVDKESDIEWARIPHLYRDFYVYQYVTGYSAATTLAEKIQTEGAVAQKRYINYLKSGGSDYSLNLLKQAGVDMSSAKPLEVTLQKFSLLLDELEKTLNESR
ncbi:MAG: oligoendopeptidase [Firmicutes bacterium]|nr:oligoendopeptidase [Bacillota bacterium]